MQYFLYIIVTIAAGALLYFAAYRSISHLIDKRLENYQKDLLSKHYDEVRSIYQKMRGWRHDYHNHIQTMKAHLALNQLDELKEYLDMLDNDLNTVDTVIKTGNVMIDAILNSKLSLMKDKGINVNARAKVPSKLNVTEVDLCTIIGNLLDNAMESCEKIEDEKSRFIRIYIGILKGQLYISVTNSTGSSIRKAGNAAYMTTKGHGHGFGLKRIDAIVKKYGGYLNRQNEPGVFAVEIMLPL